MAGPHSVGRAGRGIRDLVVALLAGRPPVAEVSFDAAGSRNIREEANAVASVELAQRALRASPTTQPPQMLPSRIPRWSGGEPRPRWTWLTCPRVSAQDLMVPPPRARLMGRTAWCSWLLRRSWARLRPSGTSVEKWGHAGGARRRDPPMSSSIVRAPKSLLDVVRPRSEFFVEAFQVVRGEVDCKRAMVRE